MTNLEKLPELASQSETPSEVVIQDDPIVQIIERLATNPDADIDKLERILAMKERTDAKASEVAFNEALAAAQEKMPSVAAVHQNDQTKSKFSKLKDIYAACKPILAQHRLSFNAVPVSGGREGYLNMRWTLRHGGHTETDVSEIPIDNKGMKGTANKTDTHAYGSTTTYGRRYLFCAVFDIAIDDDNDGNANRKGGSTTIDADQYREIKNLLEKSGVAEQIVLDAVKVPSLEMMDAKDFEPTKKKLTLTIERNGGDK